MQNVLALVVVFLVFAIVTVRLISFRPPPEEFIQVPLDIVSQAANQILREERKEFLKRLSPEGIMLTEEERSEQKEVLKEQPMSITPDDERDARKNILKEF